MAEIKIVITGSVGAGKTTAIKAISDIPVVSTDVNASDEVALEKETTTVAMDYGQMSLADGKILSIYGTPGQRRFSFMWEILAEGALGFIVLVNDRRKDSLADLDIYLDNFANYLQVSPTVIGVTHVQDEFFGMDKYYQHLEEKGLYFPLFPIDARRSGDVRTMIEAMASMIGAGGEKYVIS